MPGCQAICQAGIFQLLSGKDQSLLVWWNAFLVLDLLLDGLNVTLTAANDAISKHFSDKASDASTSRVIVFPVRVLTKICILCVCVNGLVGAEERGRRSAGVSM